MPILLRNDIKSVYVKGLELNGSKIEKICLESKVIKKDALFYKGLLGNMISFDYNTTLPSLDEAESYVEQQVGVKPQFADVISCLYVDEDNMKLEGRVAKKRFKQLKKDYKKSSIENKTK